MGHSVRRQRQSTRRPATKGLCVLSRQSLGKDLSIAAVMWGDREVLVGISGSTFTFLNDARYEDVSVPDQGGEPTVSDKVRPTSDIDDDLDDDLGDPSPSRPRLLAEQGSSRFSPALLAAVATRSGRAPAHLASDQGQRPSLLEALRDATSRR